jgi:hypothetical protein
MSTAIALKDVEPTSQHKDTTTVRHRTVVNTDNNASSSSLEDEAWLNIPHDSETSKLPLESQPFSPSTVYWISPHSTFASKVAVLDLTKDMEIPYTGLNNEYKAAITKTLKDHSYTPAITCNRNGWFSLQYDITDDQSNHLAHWSHSWSSFGEALLTFPEDSQHSSHTISLHNKTWGLRTETFTLDSQPFFWEMDSLWHSTNMTLYKSTGSGETEKKVEVGKYAQKWWGGFVTGGTFVVDEKEIDGVVACLTLIVVLRKKRQRATERYPSSGG